MQKKVFGYQLKIVFGMAVICAITAVFLAVFLGASKTEITDTYLSDFGMGDTDWEYEFLADGIAEKFKPEFDEVGYVKIPAKRPQAVKISRTLTEDIPEAEIELNTGLGRAAEVFLDDVLLYTDLPGVERNKEGYLLPDEETRRIAAAQCRAYRLGKNVRFSLPPDYVGKRLVIITYFLEEMEEHVPVYPYLGSWASRFTGQVADAVMPVAAMVLCAVCVVLLMLVFLLELANGRSDWKILLIVLYFVLLFVSERYGTSLGNLSRIEGWAEILTTSDLFMIPLCIYLALLLSGWRRIFAFGGMALWIGYEGICTWNNIREGFYIYGDWNGFGSFVLVLLFAAAFLLEYVQTGKWQSGRRRRLPYVILTVFVATACVVYEINRVYGGSAADFFRSMLELAGTGYFVVIVSLAQNTCAAMAVIILISEFLRDSAKTRTLVAVLQERQKATMEGYERMLKAEETVNAACHEMRHHITALSAFIRNSETERAGEYLSALEKNIDQVPTFKYSRNILVNVVAGTYLDQAKKEGIRVECAIAVPEELQIADEDLSVYLSNLLQNSVEACERMEDGADRYIRLKMYQKEHFLFIGCVNSFSKTEMKDAVNGARREHREHGYGIEAMKNIAEKYGSILKIDRRDGEYSVMSNLNLAADR